MRMCPHRIGEQVDFTTTDNPNVIWPQTTWTAVEGSFPLASSSGHALGATGGSETITLDSTQIPSHTHQGLFWWDPDNMANIIGLNGGTYGYVLSWSGMGGSTTQGGGANEKGIVVGKTGGGQPHNNMPPFVTVNRWKRVA